jgi:hypothetical protein
MATNQSNDPSAPFRDAAAKAVDQAREAFQNMLGMAQKTIIDMESNAGKLQRQMRDQTRGALDFASESADATFSLVERLARAKDSEEAMAIQKAFLTEQMERLNKQAKAVGEDIAKATASVPNPFDR